MHAGFAFALPLSLSVFPPPYIALLGGGVWVLVFRSILVTSSTSLSSDDVVFMEVFDEKLLLRALNVFWCFVSPCVVDGELAAPVS